MIIKTERGIKVLSDQQIVTEELSIDDIEREIQDTQAAIDDIDSFRQRRLDNLMARLSILNGYKNLLGE